MSLIFSDAIIFYAKINYKSTTSGKSDRQSVFGFPANDKVHGRE